VSGVQRFFLVFSLSLFLFSAGRLQAAPSTTSQATITSDELELRDNGALTFFRGHVVLTEDPYVLHADRMLRTKATGIVDADGHLDGTWISDKGEKIKAYGQQGRYTPMPQVTDLWEKARLIRWETSRDTEPVQVTADHFTAYHQEREFYAKGHVVMTQDPKILSRSDEAQYDQKIQTIHLYGAARVFVHVADAKGSGDFTGEEGWVTLAPKTARLVGHVQGHVIPGSSL
jgi:lipopolysaccharide export system protein LptA